MKPSVPANYYLNYFKQMLVVVSNRYADLLNQTDSQFIHHILNGSEPAMRLLVRLYMRKGPYFIVDKLNYAEVENITEALIELEAKGLVESDPLAYAHELIELLPIAQSRTLFSEGSKRRKAQILEDWKDNDTLSKCTQWNVKQTIITPCHYDTFRRLQIFYFGSEQQSLTDFILEDLGLFKYETLQLEKENRLFNIADEVEQLIQINDLAFEFYTMNETKQWSDLNNLATITYNVKPCEKLQPRWHRFLNRMAYRLEQLGELDQAEALFKTNTQPPARERLIRILFKKENYSEAHTLLKQLADAPCSYSEIQFHRRFVNKINMKLDLPKIKLVKPTFNEMSVCWTRQQGSVEEQAVQHFENSIWLENSLPMAIFGMLHWPIIFANISGVWHHPFQAGPSDLNEPEFTLHRKNLLSKLADQSISIWRESIEACWHEKHGIRNPFVNWSALSLDIVLNCFDALNKTQWQGIFEHILSDVRQHRSGFPDLFQVTKNSYRFIEIKGPGDKLQDNQITWLTLFKELNVNAEVCYVQYLDT